MHHFLLYITLPSLRDYKVKVSNFTFCGGREHQTTTFFVLVHRRFIFPTTFRWRSMNPPQFKFYHARSKGFEEKIEGL